MTARIVVFPHSEQPVQSELDPLRMATEHMLARAAQEPVADALRDAATVLGRALDAHKEQQSAKPADES
jgi:hypothetical protein